MSSGMLFKSVAIKFPQVIMVPLYVPVRYAHVVFSHLTYLP
jgi:hypothetical protein